MREPYEEPWGQTGTYRGIQTVPTDVYAATVKELNRLGWRVFTHAVGDTAIDQVLDAYEAANAEKSIVGRRWGIEHGFIPHGPRPCALTSMRGSWVAGGTDFSVVPSAALGHLSLRHPGHDHRRRARGGSADHA
jgi:hypothetical protein